ncbi:MAG TPA: hypothetical protein VGM62_12920 [Chthoniobacterales bacterium]|jgi:hypothetical protein
MASSNFFTELKRRKVFKVGAAYLVAAWLAVQAASIGFPAFDAPPWALRIFILFALLGFPIAVMLAWVFDVTPEGVKFDPETSGSKRLFAAAALLIVRLRSLGQSRSRCCRSTILVAIRTTLTFVKVCRMKF